MKVLFQVDVICADVAVTFCLIHFWLTAVIKECFEVSTCYWMHCC